MVSAVVHRKFLLLSTDHHVKDSLHTCSQGAEAVELSLAYNPAALPPDLWPHCLTMDIQRA